MNPHGQVQLDDHEPLPKRSPVAVYVVLSHRDPHQVERLIRAIRTSSPSSHVYVWHDARQSATPTSSDPQVHVRAHGARTDWGSWRSSSRPWTHCSGCAGRSIRTW